MSPKNNHKKRVHRDFPRFVEDLENRILTGGFKPREHLVEAKLSRMFAVSRYWVRDAFKILEAKGLVRITPYKGVAVSELEASELEEIFAVRVPLEQLAWRLAMHNAVEKDLERLQQIAQDIAQAHAQKSIQAVLAADTEFHDQVLKLCRNRTLRRLITDLRKRSHIARFAAWSSPEVVRQVAAEHYQFVEALRQKDTGQLDELARRHINHAREFYLFGLRAEGAVAGARP
ncbi:MAG: GntR family transcriptional regulator [Desulfarculus sp.]|nr:MAG: GntR family transcriptional regulator [Desulfarculus sp.]